MQKQSCSPVFHIMAKPAGARCNLSCDYCYYRKMKSLYPKSSFCMSDSIMERYISQTISAHTIPEVTIAWQGGEPTLMGIDFFTKAVCFQKKAAGTKVKIQNTIQTNGVLLDEDWCHFLHENDFLVGISLDGPRKFHDMFRKDRKGNSVFDKVTNAVHLMQKFKVNFNILCTVNSYNCQNPNELYRFFRDDLHANYLQFIPVVESNNTTGNNQGDFISQRTVPSEAYGNFLIKIFDEWISRDVGTMFIQFFDGVLSSYLLGQSSLCVLQPTCGHEVVLEHNGDIYSCDHYVQPDYLLGNIKQSTVAQLVDSEKQRQFGSFKNSSLPQICHKCEFLFTCYGECPKNRLLQVPDGSGKLNWLCTGL
ncbi:MAG TPA: anaerobic sulfatase maturase, partial [Chitinispirillaceae bacterium]|nr:anaerobic sulfatase maturase [Chitinispirillaceae bacterium]